MKRLALKRFPIKPLKCILNVLTLKLALPAKCFIYGVELNPFGIAFSNIVDYFLLLLFHTFHFSHIKNKRYEKEERFYHC